ncbi:MAG: thioredoxin [Planctomycetota bacterium]
MSSLPNVGTANFQEEVLDATLPVVVDFYADWCGPCKMLAPVLDKLAAEYAGKIKFVKVNADLEPDLTSQAGVTGFPTVLFIKEGHAVDGVLGFAPYHVLKERCEGALSAVVKK